jgi:anti-sigma factor RsiW
MNAMHEPIRANLEAYLDNPSGATGDFQGHLQTCAECKSEVADLIRQSRMLQSLRTPEVEPDPGFYARVRERIDAEAKPSVFAMLLDNAFGRPIAVASAAMVLLLASYIVTTEPGPVPPPPGAALLQIEDQMQPVSTPKVQRPDDDRNTVLVNLVSFRD